MPTPAARATASRLASEPPALNTAFAASRTRSRLRLASVRGFRVLFSDSLMPIVRSRPLQNGGTLRISQATLIRTTRVKSCRRSELSPAGGRRSLAFAGTQNDRQPTASGLASPSLEGDDMGFPTTLPVNGVTRTIQLDDPR